MTSHGNGDRAQEDLLRRALTDAMDGAAGPEPGMPDLLGPAMAEGTRIRRRRRTTLLVALSTAAVLIGGGAAGGLAYVGGDSGGGDRVPPAGPPSAKPPGAELADLLDGYFEAKKLSVNPVPVEVRADARGGKTVKVLVHDREGRGGVLELSAARAPRPLDPGQTVGKECEVLRKLDLSGPESSGPVAACDFVGAKSERTLAWDISMKRASDADPARYGTVRIGPNTEIVRVWMLADRFPVAATPTSLYVDGETLTRISADGKLPGLLDALPNTSANPSKAGLPSQHPPATTT